jgi:thiamine-phosphate pyrophosphorylase
MTPPRLFLVAPAAPAPAIVGCVRAAASAGDVASVLLRPEHLPDAVKPVQALGIAVLTTGEQENVMRHGCDGLHIEAGRTRYDEARAALGKERIIGTFCAASRHLAMEMAEAGADYVAFSQNARAAGGLPIVSWWSQMFEVPCVAFDPVAPAGLDTLLPQNPDFIRPTDDMWTSPERAADIVSRLMAQLTG